MSLLTIILFFHLFSLSCAYSSNNYPSSEIGVNYGGLGNNLPHPSKAIKLIKSINASWVKLYNPEPAILHALKGSNLKVSIMVPNELLINVSTNQTFAKDWIKSNFLPYYPSVLIRHILIGNEILSLYQDDDVKKAWVHLVPAMKRIKFVLKTFKIRNVKVGTPLAMDMLESNFPPSNGTFRSDIAKPVMKPMLNFLKKTKSFLFVDCYTYFHWNSSYPNISLQYALLEEGAPRYRGPVSGLVYTNLLDQLLDAVVYAMRKLGFNDVRLWICETGWPNGGDIDQFAVNVRNAATYNRNLVRKLTSRPSKGTPARPGVPINTFIFALFNENMKYGPGTERHWGLFYPTNGTLVYPIDLSGRTNELHYPPLPPARNNRPYKGKIWCVMAKGVHNMTALALGMASICLQSNGTCDAIQPGKQCYAGSRNGLVLRASYVFSAFWAKFRSTGDYIKGNCFYGGLAEQTTKDPSYGSCKYPSVTLH